MSEAFVKNAADPEQVARAREREIFGRELELDDIRKVVATESGRRLLWRLLEGTKVFGSIYEQSSRIYYNAGQQDFGHFIMAEIIEAEPQALFKMMSDAALKDKDRKIKKEK